MIQIDFFPGTPPPTHPPLRTPPPPLSSWHPLPPQLPPQRRGARDLLTPALWQQPKIRIAGCLVVPCHVILTQLEISRGRAGSGGVAHGHGRGRLTSFVDRGIWLWPDILVNHCLGCDKLVGRLTRTCNLINGQGRRRRDGRMEE